jgi:hypothetical protein
MFSSPIPFLAGDRTRVLRRLIFSAPSLAGELADDVVAIGDFVRYRTSEGLCRTPALIHPEERM